MFFTDELLMAKRGSLGIIWLVSTLGPRNKRVSRKALENVEIPRTCDIIASPPEPLALRLSGQLLVGVARVYSQTYEHFYADVQTFDSALRRSIAIDFGPLGKLAGGTELDLPGGGRTRLELITFADFEPGLEGYLGIDLEFGNIDWLNPDLSSLSRHRRHTTPLDSLKTQSVPNEEDDEAEEPRDNRRTSPHITPNTNNDKAPLYKPFERQTEDTPEEFEPMDLDIILDSNPHGPSSGGTIPPAFNCSDPSDDLVDHESIVVPQPDLGSDDFILHDQVHSSPTPFKRKGDSSRELSDVESQLAPAPKPKKRKKVNRTKFDDDLELDLDLAGMEAAYVEAMAQKWRELAAKARNKEAARKAENLLVGADTWSKFLDPDIGSFIKGCSSVRKFKWQMDAKSAGNRPHIEDEDPVTPVDPMGVHPHSDDPFIDAQLIDDYPMAYPDVPDIPGVARRERSYDLEQPRSGGASDLPWMAPSDYSDLPGPIDSGQTSPQGINTPRVSDMSPLELSIRKRQRNSSTALNFTTRSRSGSILSVHLPGLDNLQLVSDDNVDQLPQDDRNTRFPQGHPFAPTMLATLEDQCRDFFSFVDKTLLKTSTDELELTDLAPRGQSKRVAVAAFHNCLTLATKRLLSLSQDTAYGPITIRISPA